ncbi:MAG: pantetheine-phosphate adenylyltransferase [Ruminococcaceae bacterium]|nr:pantetheine-phosphate adenylyltransferase [Oscillospiraceae bacterium]
MRTAVYPGSFDPMTNGHLDIIKRAAKTFDKVYVAILTNSSKKPKFSLEQRIDWLKRATADLPNVEIDSFSGLLVNYANQINASIIIKGLRAVSDFEYEFQMALTNRALSPNIETMFLMTNGKYSYLSSSIVKEIANLGGSLNGLVPDFMIEEIKNEIKKTQ